MSELIFLFFTAIISCNAAATTENFKMPPKSLESSTAKSNVKIASTQKQLQWTNPYSTENSLQFRELGKLERIANTKVDNSNVLESSGNRRSKILRSLAFLAGLSVGSLAGAASSDVKTYAKIPSLKEINDSSRISSQLTAIYNPYPYLLAPPFGFFTPLDLLKLQSINNNAAMQNSQLLNLLDANKFDDSSDQYFDENRRVENVNGSSGSVEDLIKDMQMQAEDERNVDEKVQTTPKKSGCNLLREKQKSISTSREDDDDSLTTINSRAANTTAQNQNSSTINGTNAMNNQTYPPFNGYYGGYPQTINHIDLTTQPYYAYGPPINNNYNLPSYEKPGNFYSDDRFNYYPAPVDYPSNQFNHEIPEYLSHDFKRYLYRSDNSFGNNEFRSVA